MRGGADPPESWKRRDEPADADDLVLVPCDPIAAARALLAEFPIRAPEDIAIELMAAARDAYVVPRETGTADARMVCDGAEAFICIAPAALATPRGRFSVAHELAHWLMHRAAVDAIERIHGRPRTRGREFRVEREANTCASELLLPYFLFAPICAREAPTLDAISRTATVFGTSLTATARRWAAVSGGRCAWVESNGGIVRDHVRGAAFRGEAVRGRKVQKGTAAAALLSDGGGGERAAREHRAAWGAGAMGGVVFEESIRVTGTELVLTWLWHA